MKTARSAFAPKVAWAVLSLLAAGCWQDAVIVLAGSPDAGGDTDSDTALGCYEGSYEIETAADVELLAPYECVTGDLQVSDAEIVSLDLPNLEWIGGDFRIGVSEWGGGSLESLGLDHLTSVGGSFTVYNTSSLTSLDGLDGLALVGGRLHISGNWMLTDISALAGIEHVDAELLISENPLLTSLDGLQGVASVETDLEINDNDQLTSLDGLDGLTSVGIALRIRGNDGLTSLDGIGGLASIGGTLVILWNGSLASLEGLGGLASIGGLFEVRNNFSLPVCEICGLLAQIADGLTDDPYVLHNLDDACGNDETGLVCP